MLIMIEKYNENEAPVSNADDGDYDESDDNFDNEDDDGNKRDDNDA